MKLQFIRYRTSYTTYNRSDCREQHGEYYGLIGRFGFGQVRELCEPRGPLFRSGPETRVMVSISGTV